MLPALALSLMGVSRIADGVVGEDTASGGGDVALAEGRDSGRLAGVAHAARANNKTTVLIRRVGAGMALPLNLWDSR